MKAQVLDFLHRLDPCLIFSLLFLIVLVPIGFTVDHTKLESHCASSPIAYLGYNFSSERIPIPFEWFIGNASSEIELILASNHPAGDDNHTNYYVLLKRASDRHVAVKLITDDLDMYENFTFCKERYFINDPSIKMFAYMAQSDHSKAIYSSDLLSQNICQDGRFLLDFPNCRSVANDVSSIFGLLADFSSAGFPASFDHRTIPGSLFPQQHSLPDGLCKLAISPRELVPPGRSDVVELLFDFFDDFGEELAVVSQSLFPISDQPSASMPELLLSERIETGALNRTKIRILVPEESFSLSHCQVRSLMQFPNVEIRAIQTMNCTLPAMYTFGQNSGFLAIPYEQIVRTGALTFGIHVRDGGVARNMQDHFLMLWNHSVPMNMTGH